MHNFEGSRGALAERCNLVVGKRGMAAIDMTNHIRVGLEHHVLIDQARSGDGRSPRMNRALDAVFTGPGDHLVRSLAVFYATQTHFAQYLDSGGGKLFEIILDHAMLNYRSSGVDFNPARPEGVKGTLRKDRHRLQSNDVLGTTGRMHFAGRNH